MSLEMPPFAVAWRASTLFQAETGVKPPLAPTLSAPPWQMGMACNSWLPNTIAMAGRILPVRQRLSGTHSLARLWVFLMSLAIIASFAHFLPAPSQKPLSTLHSKCKHSSLLMIMPR